MSAPTERDWDVVPYQPGDERDILELFNREFHQSRSMEHWRWKFLTNPYGGPFHMLARRRRDGKLCGNHIVMPFPLNLDGRKLIGCHSLDLVVDPEYRGQGIFEKTGGACMERCRDAGVSAVVAFPNQNSYPGFVRTLGWRRITFLTRWSFALDRARKLRSKPLVALASPPFAALAASRVAAKRRSDPGTGLRFTLERQPPAGHDVLWRALASLEVLSLWKDREYLQWRYAAHPDQVYHFAALYDGDTLVAETVIGLVGTTLWIAELFALGRELSLARALVARVLEQGLAWHAAEAVFLGHDAGWFAQALIGFDARPAADVVYVGRALADDALTRRMELPGNWLLTFGDADFV